MVEIALIPPYSCLGDIRNRHLQMFLPTCLRSAYADQYQMLAATRPHIMLDNGMFEEGKPVDNEELLNMAMQFGVHEVVLPDVPGDSASTLRTFQTFWTQYFSYLQESSEPGLFSDLRFVIPVQGSSLGERTELIDRALSDVLKLDIPTKRVVIGLPRHMTRERTSARLDTMEHIITTYGNRFKLHMLGMSREWPGEFLRAVRQFGSHLRGMDTSAPYVYAYHSGTITPQWDAKSERPRDYFLRPLTQFPQKLVAYNIYVLESWSLSTTPSSFHHWKELL